MNEPAREAPAKQSGVADMLEDLVTQSYLLFDSLRDLSHFRYERAANKELLDKAESVHSMIEAWLSEERRDREEPEA